MNTGTRIRFNLFYEDHVKGKLNLDEVVNWIKAEFMPEDVFDESELREWAAENAEPGNLYAENPEKLIAWARNQPIEAIFTPAQITEWYETHVD